MSLFDSHARYINPEPLGSGGMGTVFKVLDKKLHRQVALKVMNAVVLKQDDVKRFEREAQSMAQMQHPHICPIHDFDRVEGHPYLVMDLIAGQSLQDVLEKDWPPPAKDIAKWIWQIARALRHAHGKGVLHRDLKPANIMINAEGDAILMDFGLAQYRDATESLTKTGHVMGTMAYASPEQAWDTKTVDDRADVYSLGAVLYVLLCRNLPYQGDSLSIVIQLREGKTFPPPSAHYSFLDTDLEAICLKAAAYDPASRYQSMDEFAAALESYLSGTLVAAIAIDTEDWIEETKPASPRPEGSSNEKALSANTPMPTSEMSQLPSIEPIASTSTESLSESPDTQSIPSSDERFPQTPLEDDHGSRIPSHRSDKSPLFIRAMATLAASLLGNLLGVPLVVSLGRSDHYFEMAIILAADLGLIGLVWLFRAYKSTLIVLSVTAGVSLLLTLLFLALCVLKQPKYGIADEVGIFLLAVGVFHWVVTLSGGLVAGAVWAVGRFGRQQQ